MPKLKSKRAASKRFRRTAGGIKCKPAFHNHILTKKNAKRKSRLDKVKMVDESDAANIARLLLVNIKKIK